MLSALMAAAWSSTPHSTLSCSKLASLLFSSAQLAAALPAAQLKAAADAAVLAALGSSTDTDDTGTAVAAAGGAAQQRTKQQQLSAAEVVRVLWSLAVLDVLDIARLGWLLVALAGSAGWQKLQQEQLLVVRQAQVKKRAMLWFVCICFLEFKLSCCCDRPILFFYM